MADDEGLAERVREVLAGEEAVTERKMFGGLAFMLAGHMVCGIIREELMLRLGPEAADGALGRPHVRPMDLTGRPMKNIVILEPPAFEADADLRRWIAQATAYVADLPPK